MKGNATYGFFTKPSNILIVSYLSGFSGSAIEAIWHHEHGADRRGSLPIFSWWPPVYLAVHVQL